jgi:hypothetical protein
LTHTITFVPIHPTRDPSGAVGECAERGAGADEVDQVARRFGQPHRQQAVDQGRQGRRDEHPAPGGQTQPQLVGGAAGDSGDASLALVIVSWPVA